MTQAAEDPQGSNRWTRGDVTPGEDPREIDREQTDAETVDYVQKHRTVVNAEDETGDELGTSSTTHDPTERR